MARFLLTAEMRLRPPSRSEVRAIRATIEAALRDIRLDIELDARPATDSLDRVDTATRRVESSAKIRDDSYFLAGEGLGERF